MKTWTEGAGRALREVAFDAYQGATVLCYASSSVVSGSGVGLKYVDTEMTNQETDLVAKHLEELKAFRDIQIAARFEVVANRGWLRNLFVAREPWIEIRWTKDEHLQLDLITLEPSSPMPVAWERKSGSTWLIPMAESSGLVEWISREWLHARGTTNNTLKMWTE